MWLTICRSVFAGCLPDLNDLLFCQLFDRVCPFLFLVYPLVCWLACPMPICLTGRLPVCLPGLPVRLPRLPGVSDEAGVRPSDADRAAHPAGPEAAQRPAHPQGYVTVINIPTPHHPNTPPLQHPTTHRSRDCPASYSSSKVQPPLQHPTIPPPHYSNTHRSRDCPASYSSSKVQPPPQQPNTHRPTTPPTATTPTPTY